jgi:transposase
MNKVSEEIMTKIGIDVGKTKLDVAWLRELEPLKVKCKVFKNNEKDFSILIEWALHNTQQSIDMLHFVMEATGIYHEALAYALFKAGAKVSVVNPAKIHAYAKSLGRRSKTDKKDSVTIARYGATQSLTLWQPEPIEIRQLKALVSRYNMIDKDLQRERNRLEKVQIAQVSDEVILSINTLIIELKKEQDRIKKLIDQHIDQNPQMKTDRKYLESIPGVGPVISKLMIAMIRSRNFSTATQCSAYVGLNPVHHESGTSIKGRSHISKMGDSKIRAKLYMAAVVAIQHNPDIKHQYERLLQHGKSKMSAICAAMRKLVQICFGVLKHQTNYQPQTQNLRVVIE